MKVKTALPFLVVLSTFALAAQASDEHKEARKEAVKHTGLARFKQLAGEWTGKEAGGHGEFGEVHIKYKVTSGGSAVVETIFPDTAHEMVTVIHQDGKDLALTHYCALGNQPHMKADPKGNGNKVEFKFTGASNLKSEKDMHMHDVTFTFVDKDTLRTEWTHYQDGKKSGTATFELKRKK